MLHSGGGFKDVALICVHFSIEKFACCAFLFAWIMERYDGHVANVKRIDTRYYQIGRYWPREFDKGILRHLLSATEEARSEFAV